LCEKKLFDPEYAINMSNTATITVKAVPGASKDEIVGFLGDDLKVRVRQPPEGGRANRAIVALLAEMLEVSQKTISITAGEHGSRKTLAIAGLDARELTTRLKLRLGL
jgi:uncharacterized protein (TIGR00251 family)